MKKKISGIVVALLLLFQTIFGASAWMADASVQESVYGQVTNAVYGPTPAAPVANPDSILTKVVLTDKDGTVIDAVYNPDNTVNIGEAVKLSYEWALPNGHDYKDGSTFTFELPSQFAIFTDIDEPLATDQGDVGRFTIDRNGKVVMTFNDYVENHSNVSGKLEIWTEFKEEIVKGSTEIILTIPVRSGEQTVIVNLKPKGGKLIEKQGYAVGKDQINWTVKINTTLDKIKNARVTDVIPEGLELIGDSVEVYHLQVNGDGSTKTGDKVDADKYSLETNGGTKLELAFNDETISKAYEIRFSTNLTGERTGEQATFKNTAMLSGDDREDAKAEATVKVEFGKFLDKSANVDKDTGIVTWTVKYNFNEKDLTEEQAVITDEFSDIHTLIAASLKVYKGDSTKEEDLLSADKYFFTPKGTNGFTLQFKDGIDSPYTIVYQTKPVDRTSAEGKQVKNKVVSGEASKETTAPAQEIRALVKGVVGNVDYAKKEAKWHITVNADRKPDGGKYSMENVVIKDSFPNGGLEFIPDSLIVRADGKVVPASDYKVEYDNDNLRGGFVIKFSKTIDTTHTIEYQTKFNIDWLKGAKFLNKASMTWLEGGKSKGPIDRYASFNPDGYTTNNGGKDGTYNPISKEITWNIKLNYNLVTVNEAKVTDVLKQGQTLVPNSVKVYEMELTGGWNGVKKGKEVSADQYEVTVPSAENGNELSVQFKNQITTAYWIEFKTSLQGAVIEKVIENTAELWDGSKRVTTLKGSLSVPHGGEYVKKSGKQNGNKIDWTIRINEGQSHISKAKIIDEPSANQILIEDSFHLYVTKIDNSGNAIKDETKELVKGTDYTLNITRDGDQESFELSFLKDISSAYILEYQSFINAEDKAEVKNKVKLEGENLTIETRETTETIIVRTSSGSGSGGGETGSLEVTKVDKDDPTKTLAGAKFVLYDKGEKRAPIVKTTDENGKILFTKLLYDDYILEELAAPEGYKIVEAKQEITINSGIKSEGNVKKITVTNLKDTPVDPGNPVDPTGSLEVTKVDKDDPTKTLAGAKFKLSDKAGKRDPIEKTTGEDGKLLFDQLPYDEYVLEELIAPEGYVAEQTKYDVKVDADTNVVTIEVKNAKKPGEPNDPTGSLEVTKVDKDDPTKTLAGAKFKLSDKAGQREAIELTTGEDGKLLFDNLPYGDYVLEELIAPQGYVAEQTKYDVTVNADTVKDGNVVGIVVTNAKEDPTDPGEPGNPGNPGNPTDPTGSLEVTKVDKDDHTKTLAGAKFKLSDKAGQREPIELTTGEDGKLLFDKLPYDDYVLEELAAPQGYVAEQTKYDVTVNADTVKDGNVVAIVVTNAKEDPTDPGEPGNPGNPGNPGSPSDPDDSDDSDDSSDSDDTSNPGSPSNPSNPPGSDTPTTPGTSNPGQPGTPTNPGTPPGGDVDVPDEDVPLGGPTPSTPSTEGPGTPTVDIVDEDVPRGGGDPNPVPQNPAPQTPVPTLPKTGEASRYPYYLAGLALIAFGVWLGRKRMMKQ